MSYNHACMAQKVKKNGVPRELERAGALGLAFANTTMPAHDNRRKAPVVEPALLLDSYARLIGWVQRMGALAAADCDRLRQLAAERPEEAARVIAAARELRPAILQVFTAVVMEEEPRPQDLDSINAALRVRRIVRGPEGFGWAETGAPDALDRVLAPIAQSAADLLTSDRLPRLRQCAAKGCFRLYIYRSPRRLWCDMNLCGNRLKGQRNRERWRRARSARIVG